MTRSRRSTRPPRARARDGGGFWTQIWPGRSTSIAHDHILAMLGTFPARGMVAQWLRAGVVENGRLSSHRGGNSSRRCGQPRAAEHRPARDGAGRRSPLPDDRPAAGQIVAGCPVLIRYADDLVALCHSRQEALEVKAQARRLAGAQGSGVQRGQDACRHPRRGLRLPRIQRPPLRRQAPDQAEQGGRQTDPGTAAHRAAVPARDQRAHGDQEAQPDHPGMGRLLPDTGLQRGVRRAGRLPVAAHIQVGQVQPREQADPLGRSPGTTAGSTRPA